MNHMNWGSISKLLLGIFVLWSLLGCESTYYKTMETMGYHKRDIMVDRVEDARDAQEEAKEQFESALEKFSSVLEFKGGSLQEKYGRFVCGMAGRVKSIHQQQFKTLQRTQIARYQKKICSADRSNETR